ncbi:alcohol dehydrogenase [Pontibacillus chungwhensis BH030062]|uniref:Alcohol dehydrogenase n=1 Tax=Pontibacillus chungwhensis BH030062 TaxID=1385513 RepID=A0A0A2URS1_9BACI|nr:iron-containing alcohol dehydrogenase family protein [Pontibacillus chungwhensis]KGP90639.1 alcohol dehydrogenase [Pontibacillus chungwhensis BH030062]
MVNPDEIVRSGPNQYICEEGIFRDITTFTQSFRSPVVITGHQSFEAFKNYGNVPSGAKVYQHDGYCSDEVIRSISEFASGSDLIIGIGGGVILDTAKSVADHLGVEVITVPTVAGTCAAATPLSVMYDDTGAFVRVDYHTRTIHIALVDPTFLLSSPLDYVKSGISDSLAKWYEAEPIIHNDQNEDLSIMVKVALDHASYIKEILLNESRAAIESMETSTMSPSFKNVVEAIIPLSGTVGGYGGKYGRTAGAHAIHNGLSFIDETHTVLHGHKVAYGILVQLVLEGKSEEVKNLLPFYHDLGFPSNLEGLNIVDSKDQAMKTVASHAVKPDETLQLISSFTESDVVEAMKYLESALVKR